MTLATRVAELTGAAVNREQPLSGGCIGDVRRLDLADGRRVVAKLGDGHAPGLALEGWMLTYLSDHSAIPVPQVLHADDTLLLMTYIETAGGMKPAVERDAADRIAALHAATAPRFGLDRDTLIGGLPQPNTETESWIDFFRDHRLMHRARDAHDAGRLPASLLSRIETLCSRLDRWLTEPAEPSLIHGDLWTGNVLVADGKLAGVVDPALYYADAEIELAFTTLFGTFGDAFFARYGEHRPIAPGFFEERRDLYNLYPLLVHVRLFGGGYVGSVERTLRQFGI